jgi:hypothetical protein
VTLITSVWVLFFSGLVCCGFYLLFPPLYSVFRTPEGSVWVPINNEHRLPGDGRIYAACVQEVRLNFFKFKHPCSSEIGNMAIDFTRVSSYRLAALLGFFVENERLAILISFCFSVLIQYSGIFLLSFFLFHSGSLALLMAIAALFWYKTLVYFRENLKELRNYVLYNLLNKSSNTFFDRVNDNFRYVVLSTSGIFVWFSMILIFLITIGADIYTVTTLTFFYFLFIPFAYPAVTAISVGILVIVVTWVAVLDDSLSGIVSLSVSGLVAIVVLLVAGVERRIAEIRSSSMNTLTSAHNRAEVYQFNLISFWKFVVSDAYFYLPVITIIITWRYYSKATIMLPAALGLVATLKFGGYVLRKNGIVVRFIERGGLHFLFFSLIASILLILKSAWTGSYDLPIIAVCSILVIVPLIGSYRIGKRLFAEKSFYMPKKEWELYDFIKYNTRPRSTVLAFSFSNLQLIPVYTHANLYVRGGEWLEDPSMELSKYMRALRYVGSDINEFVGGVKNYFSVNFKGFLSDTRSEKELSNFHLLNTLIYYPFNSELSGFQLTNPAGTDWSSEFLAHLDKEVIVSNEHYESTPDEIDYIVVEDFNLENTRLLTSLYEAIFSNDQYLVFKRKRAIR